MIGDPRRAGTALRAAAIEAGDDQACAPYLDALAAHAQRRPVRLHVPGHKGGAHADRGLVDALGRRALALDIPSLIDGIDLGPEPTPLTRARRLAADAWGARRTWFLVHGASQGNHVACLALAQLGRSVVVQRNVHGSVVDGLVLSGLEPEWVQPRIDPAFGLAHGITPEDLDGALRLRPDAAAAIVVSPTYFGTVPDLEALAAVAHAHGVPLVVDEAWGGHLAFHPDLPAPALACGADLVISSTHKHVGSLTQSAMLHLGHGVRIGEDAVERALALVSTTSPSALLLASLDAARRHAATRGSEVLDVLLADLCALRAELRALGLPTVGDELAGRPGIAAVDPLRVTIDVLSAGLGGRAVARALRDEHDVHVEMADGRVVVALFGMGEDDGCAAGHLLGGLRTALRDRPRRAWSPPAAAAGTAPPAAPALTSPRVAALARHECVPLAAAAGRVCAQALSAYPPGIPTALPGEQLTPDVLAYLVATLADGGVVRGAGGGRLDEVRVVAEEDACSA